jgi:hypothetical protein
MLVVSHCRTRNNMNFLTLCTLGKKIVFSVLTVPLTKFLNHFRLRSEKVRWTDRQTDKMSNIYQLLPLFKGATAETSLKAFGCFACPNFLFLEMLGYSSGSDVDTIALLFVRRPINRFKRRRAAPLKSSGGICSCVLHLSKACTPARHLSVGRRCMTQVTVVV